MTNQTSPKLEPKTIIAIVFYILYTPIVLFLTSGHINWPMAWIYTVVALLFSIGGRLLMARKHPDLVAERAKFRDAEGVKGWDRKIVPWIAQILPFFVLIIAGFDQRWKWSPEVPLIGALISMGVALVGLTFSNWAIIENRFFSSVVRIQTDRGHTVCNTGPYKYVRHPGYAGGLVWMVLTPVMLQSLWAFIPTALIVALTVLRTALEDKTLQAELPGYRAYSKETRYRLVPGIW